MSQDFQARSTQENNRKHQNVFRGYDQQKQKGGKKFSKYRYNGPYNNFQYYSAKYNYYPRWSHRRRKPPYRKTPEKSRSPSPFSGTEEHTLRKIQERSDMIMRRLMMPEDDENNRTTQTTSTNPKITEPIAYNKSTNEKTTTKGNKKPVSYNAEEIRQKIVSHITNLSHGKKMNLICASSSTYDVAIQQIQKERRLQLSKLLRDMCSNQTIETSEAFNSIMPDIGIKLEDLPLEVIQELSTNLDLNFDDDYSSFLEGTEQTVTVKNEVFEDDDDVLVVEPEENEVVEDDVFIIEPKQEIIEIKDEIKREEVSSSVETTDSIKMEVDEGVMKVEVASQTETADSSSRSTQTTTLNFLDAPKNIIDLDDAVKTMFEIDKEVARLTELRQMIFQNLQKSKQKSQKPTKSNLPSNYYSKPPEFKSLKEKILVMKIISNKNTLLTGSDKGFVYYFKIRTGDLMATLKVSDAPIIAFCFWPTAKKKIHLLVGSGSPEVREFNFHSRHQLRVCNLGENVQCMEHAWNYVFIGTANGSLMRYSLKQSRVEFEEKISKDAVLVLKATQEGARKVLLVGSRCAPVCIRDAMSGLHLRTMTDLVTPTVYSLLLEKSMVYCGTTFHDILVYNFHDGNLVHKHQATNSRGISCMKVVENLLFASCYNGNIYVYNVKTHEYVGSIEGPGGVILSMEVLTNIVIVGTMSRNFKSVLIPCNFLEHNKI